MGSSRLPGKVLLPMDKGIALELLLKRLSQSALLSKIVVATSQLDKDNPIAQFCIEKGVEVYRGDEQDVLKRYYDAAKYMKADIVVRVTADCPLFDAGVLDSMLQSFLQLKVDYLSNILPRSYPKGLDTEVFILEALAQTATHASTPEEREHVTRYLQNCQLFKIKNFNGEIDLSHHRWTLDYPEDYYFLRRVYNYLDCPTANYQQELATIDNNVELKLLSARLNKLYL